MIRLTNEPIEPQTLLDNVRDRRAGAVVLFVGVTREFTAERQTQHLDYECYPEMAEAKLQELVAEAKGRWEVSQISLVHRLGRVGLEEASVAIAVSSPHRRAAFEAGQWLIDTLKEVVPIWKCENWADGGTEWVHPGLDAQPVNAQPVNAQPVNAEPVNAEPVNAQPVNAQPVNAEPVNAEPVNAEPVNPERVEGQL
jgi:molybdopterin synthase catalytic subunit